MKNCLLAVLAILTVSCGGTREMIVPDPIVAAAEQTAKGMPFYERGCYARALEYFYRAHELYTAVGDNRGRAMSMNNIGVVYRAMGEAPAAIPFFEDTLRTYRDLGDQEKVCQALSNLAAAQVDAGDYVSAAKNIDDVLKIHALQKRFPAALTVKGILLAKQGDVQGAEALFQTALQDIGKGNPAQSAAANYAMGDLLLGAARYREAASYFEKALESDRKAGYYRAIADDLNAMGLCRAGLLDDAAAVRDWEQSVRIYALLGMEEKVRGTMDQLEEAARRSNRDIELTRALVDRWLKGQVTENICE